MGYPLASSPPANDNRDLYETPEGALFQILRARRRHLRHDISRMSAERFRQWQAVLDGLNEAEQVGRTWLREAASALPARAIPAGRFPALLRALAGLLIGR